MRRGRNGSGLTKDRIIPRTMSTQHPDNTTAPRWSSSEVIGGEDELHEAYFAYRNLGCKEVMWDSEGKDVDTNVVRKLLSSYPEYFKERVIGEDIFLTYRIPNPQIEVAERKIVTQTLQTIPLSSDVATVFYERDSVPIFEVILPFATSGSELAWLHDYYQKAIAGVDTLGLLGSITVKDWIGSSKPKNIEVIPLVERMENLLSIDGLVSEYLEAVKVDHMRVFLARSDPALNYGLIPAVLLSKIALSKLHSVEKKKGVRMHPIIGVGSMPFRGYLSPDNIENFLEEHKGLATVTTQSAFRYDYPLASVRGAVATLNTKLPNGEPREITREEQGIIVGLMGKLSSSYQKRVEGLAPLINSLAEYVPKRRTRKLHIGLFGYGRNVGGIVMPRAIPFAASFYSIGIPPEFIGAAAILDLKEEEWTALQNNYLNIKIDFKKVQSLVSWETINMIIDAHPRVARRAKMSRDKLKAALGGLMSDLAAVEDSLSVKLGPRGSMSKKYENFINNFFISYLERQDGDAKTAFVEAARLRRCIG